MATAGKKQWRRAMREVVRWRRWGVEAIIGEGWRGHVLCTFSLLSCSRDIVRPLCRSLLCTLPVNSLNLPHINTHAYLHARTCKHKHTRYNVPSTLTCIYWRRTGYMALHLSELRICHIFPIFGAATFFLTSLLPPSSSLPSLLRASSGCHSNGPPMGDRDQIITDQGIQKLKDMIFLFPPSLLPSFPPPPFLSLFGIRAPEA